MAVCGEGVRFLFLPFTWEKKNMLMDGWEGGGMNDEDGTVCGYLWGWRYIRNVLIWVGFVT